MSNFACEECGCVDNTAVTRYWNRDREGGRALCSACDPRMGKWHGLFPRHQPDLSVVEIEEGTRIIRPRASGGAHEEGT